MVRTSVRPRVAAIVLLSSLALFTACRGEPTPTPAPTATAAPTPSPDDEITEAVSDFREAAGDVLEEAAQEAELGVDADGLAAASAGDGSTLVASALVDGIEDRSDTDLAAGADVALTFLPATTTPEMEAGPYVVRVLRDSRRAWKARFVDLEGNTAGEANATVETGAASSPDPEDSDDDAEQGCRVFLERSDRKVGGGVECPTFTFSYSLDENMTAGSGEEASDLRGRMSAANDELRSSVRTALCAQAREWRITDCPSAFVVGSRDDSLVVSAPLAGEERVAKTDLESGVDSAFVFLRLSSGLGVPAGFGVLRLSADDDGGWRSELRSRDGRTVFEPTVTVNELPSRAAPGDAGGRYVSYVDETSVCTDHEYEEVDVGSGQMITVVEITCYERGAALGSPSPSPTAGTTTRRTPRPTRRPTPRPTASPTASPTATPAASPTASPDGTPTAEPTAEPTATP